MIPLPSLRAVAITSALVILVIMATAWGYGRGWRMAEQHWRDELQQCGPVNLRAAEP